MKLSTKARYSVTALYELALHYGDGPVPLSSIAQSQGLSENYLEQLMVPLRRDGLVKSIRGAQGGYMLSQAPENITIGQIITTVEGPIALVDCLLESAESAKQPCERAGRCVTRGVWERVASSIENVLNNITLHDLCEDGESQHEHVGCAR